MTSLNLAVTFQLSSPILLRGLIPIVRQCSVSIILGRFTWCLTALWPLFRCLLDTRQPSLSTDSDTARPTPSLNSLLCLPCSLCAALTLFCFDLAGLGTLFVLWRVFGFWRGVCLWRPSVYWTRRILSVFRTTCPPPYRLRKIYLKRSL